MTGATANKIIMMCSANYPNHGEDLKAKSILWMQTFQNKDDGLMETAIISCLNFCKKFPTIADIREAIKDLVYEEQTKPKQILWEVKRDASISKKAFDMVAQGKTKEYMQSIDITKLHEYARIEFPDISTGLLLQNYLEFIQGFEQQEKCWACRTQKQACSGYMTKVRLDKKGVASTEMSKCEKVQRG